MNWWRDGVELMGSGRLSQSENGSKRDHDYLVSRETVYSV